VRAFRVGGSISIFAGFQNQSLDSSIASTFGYSRVFCTDMALFSVPGWSVPSTAPAQSSKKRKRPSHDADKVQSAEINLEKLMNKLKDKDEGVDSPRAPKKRRRSGSEAEEKGEGSSQGGKGKGIAEWGLRRKDKRPSTSMISGPKKLRGKKDSAKPVDHAASMPSLSRAKSPASPISRTSFALGSKSPPAPSNLTPLQKDMKHSLDGARFR
jgi:ribosomal RNA-processing protein 8